MYDIIVVGAGPAGISAGIYGVSRGKRVLLLEKGEVGGLIGKISTVTHYAGIVPGETGDSFAQRLREQSVSGGVEIRQESVEQVQMQGDVKTVVTNQGRYECKKLILANGTTGRKLGISGEQELAGKGMGMNAAKHGALYAGKHVYVVGGADGAVKEALYLAGLAEKVTIIHFEPQLGCIAEFREKVKKTHNIQLMMNARLHAVHGSNQVEQLEIRSEVDGSITTVNDPGCGIFVYAGTVPNTQLYTELELQDGYIPVNDWMETQIPGVYAVGDIRVKQVRQVATAVADGATAAVHACI